MPAKKNALPTVRKAAEIKLPPPLPPAHAVMPPQTLDERTVVMDGWKYTRDDVLMTVVCQDMLGTDSRSQLVVEWEEHLKRLGYYLYRIEIEPPEKPNKPGDGY